MTFAETDIRATIRQYVLAEFLPGEDPESLDDTTPLITGRILDSISTMKLVGFLEEQYGITIDAHEMNADVMDSVADIEALVRGKLKNA